MLEFIGTIVIVYFAFMALDAIFRPTHRRKGQRRFVVQDRSGDYYVVQDETSELSERAEPPSGKPKLRVVK